MKLRKLILLLIVFILILAQVSICFAASKSAEDKNHKFIGGYNPDFGTQIWNITTKLTVDYNKSGTNNNLKRYQIYAAGMPHVPEIGEGTYDFPKGIKTYSGGTLIGTDYRKNFSYFDIIYDPTSTYPYMHGEKSVSYSVPTSKTAKVEAECQFNINGWTPILGSSWWTELSVSI
ncbi:hypothetical protein [Sinanaerobacter sp. ZZT-01]|uniref:hypothetical protein n=1 Tax=Sinanaerobacter sp. ZZT-01 TaxID=3111540 RepID=UPI002D79027E|nr:hypothetical protein [Sinanaerobacter sp. ZZT-01]WRR94387.1 hypothetical protein U5921_04525 [Sinanaerobacter sp. ZZT-01]